MIHDTGNQVDQVSMPHSFKGIAMIQIRVGVILDDGTELVTQTWALGKKAASAIKDWKTEHPEMATRIKDFTVVTAGIKPREDSHERMPRYGRPRIGPKTRLLHHL